MSWKLTARLLLATIATVGLASASFAQSLEAYLKLRKEHKVSAATPLNDLQDIRDSKVVEISGTIKGFIATQDNQMMIVENPSGPSLYVNAKEAPDWAKNGSVKVRMLVRVQKESPVSPIDAQFIGGIIESSISEYESKAAVEAKNAANQKAVADAKKAAERNSRTSSNTSRRPASMPGNIPTIEGAIGRTSPKQVQGVDNTAILSVIPPYADYIQTRNKRLDRSTAEYIAVCVLTHSTEYGVDPRLLMALITCESNFDPSATSRPGAQGLGQLMPGTASGLGVTDSYDINQNVWGATKYLRKQLDTFVKKTGDETEGLILALAAYNAGPGAVSRYDGVPPYRETQNYVRKVLGVYKQLLGQ